mmetsp:Transcript_28041/g.52279  ORF Transcript_28041/g.52279 Transcript_28041/m.52279 type:complete len:692 (+) Transcript_28041:36-2111(+)
MKTYFSVATLLASLSAAFAALPCDFTLEDSIAIGIAHNVDLFLSVSDESLPTFNDQLRMMNFAGTPDDKDDTTPPHQLVMFNSYLHSAHGNNYFTGYVDGQFLGYFPNDLLLRWRPAGPYDTGVEQRSAYTFDPHTGDSKDLVDTDVYDPRVRGWYIDAMDKCTSDLEGTFTCDLHWTSPYVFASNGALGITPALGFLDHSTGSPLGVTGYGLMLSDVSAILSDATQGKNSMIAYIMERDGGLIAVSNNAPVSVGGVRVNAKDSSDSLIASSSTLIIDNHLRSDQTMLVDGQLITVKRFVKDGQLDWVIVVAEPFDPENPGAEADCILAMESDMLALSRAEVDLFLTNSIEAGDLVVESFNLGLIPSVTPPSVVDELNGVQDYMYATIRNCEVIRMLYIGFTDGTFVGYNHDDQWSTFRGGDSSSDTTRNYYFHDPTNGKKLGGAFKNATYDPRIRPWYQHAQQIGTGSMSPIYVFSTGGNLGVTYSVPLYDAGGVFQGVVGADFELSKISEILEKQSEPGFGVFIFENERTSADDAYDMVATSSNAIVTNSSRQHKAYDINHIENYNIATVSKYLMENGIVQDLAVVDLPDITAEILNYDARTLNWRFGAYTTKVNNADSVTSSSSADGDDDINTVLDLAAACVALLVIVLALLVVVLVFSKNAAAAAPAPAVDTSATKNPMGAGSDSAL